MFTDLISLCVGTALPALPQNWWAAWSLAPATLLPLLALLVRAAAPSRIGAPGAGAARGLRLGGVALLAVALVSPLCRLAATLAWAHMAQLMVLVAACALLALGWRRPAGTVSRSALAAAAFCHGALLWLWHVPVVYAAVLTDATLHVAAYALLIGSAFWFWREVLHARHAHVGAALLAVVATMAHTGLLGALLTFAGTPLYALQAPGARAWGLDPLQDQQLAGLLMWVPGGLAYLLAALGLALPGLVSTRDPALR